MVVAGGKEELGEGVGDEWLIPFIGGLVALSLIGDRIWWRFE